MKYEKPSMEIHWIPAGDVVTFSPGQAGGGGDTPMPTSF